MFSTAVNDPIVPIVRERIVKNFVSNFCSEWELFRFSAELDERGPLGTVGGVEGLPLQHLLPRVLVITVVDFDYRLHLLHIRVFIFPPPP